MHVSVPVEGTVQIVQSTQISPLVDRCQIKVLYVDHKPNRNGTVITKKVAEKIGQNLPGSPIVGYFNNNQEDFEEHNKEFGYDAKEKKFGFIDTTKAYGFVPTDAKVWFQEFQDDDGVRRLYLCTEGIVWREAYPEVKRVLESGNNHSMELNEQSLRGNWAEDSNSGRRFFIINEAIVEKLCILGENYEPCFEGGQIRKEFSLHNEFETLKRSVYSMVQDALKEGGLKPMEKNKVVEQETPVVEEQTTPPTEFKKEEEEKKGAQESKNSEGNSSKENTSETDNKPEGEKSKCEEDDEKKKGKKEYSLTEIPEYVELLAKYTNLQNDFSTLSQEKESLTAEIEPLRAFKLEKEREDKQAMIQSFYMLSDDDKKDVIANIDTYSLSDIESKLSVLCVRNRVNFASAEQQSQQETNQLTFSLNAAIDQDLGAVPEWLKVAKQVEKEMN